MLLVDQEIVRELVESQDPGAPLISSDGGCVITSLGDAADPDTGVLIARRGEIASGLSGGTVPEERPRTLAHCLGDTARDLGA